jgi:hypothetical protein
MQEKIYPNLRHTMLTNTTPPLNQPALEVLLAVDAQLPETVSSSSQIITAKKATMREVMNK